MMGWGLPIIHDEGGTYGLFDDLTPCIQPHIAYALIPTAVAIAERQSEEESIDCALWLLLTLVEATQTTEVHPGLSRAFPALLALASPFGPVMGSTLTAIRKHYRNAV